jgi:hypothetical protein
MEAWAFSTHSNGDVSGLVHKTRINQSGAAGSPDNPDLHLLFLIAL